MCIDPISLTAIGAGVAAHAGAISLASTAVGAGSAIMGGIAQNKAAQYNAAIEGQNSDHARAAAADALARGDESVVAAYRKVGLIKGQQRAAIGASGFEGGFGTTATIQSDTARLAAEDADRLRVNAGREAQGFYISAANHDAQAAGLQASGRSALAQGALSAGGTLLSGASSYAAKFGSAASSAGKTIRMTQGVTDVWSGVY